MGTRTEILKIASDLKMLAAKNPAVARDLQPIVAELEATAERADKKRLEKKKAIKELVTSLERPAATPAVAPKASFLSTAVMPRLTDQASRLQLAEFEKTLNTYLQMVSNIQRNQAAALAAVAKNLR
jgi:hypothetical protein